MIIRGLYSPQRTRRTQRRENCNGNDNDNGNDNGNGNGNDNDGDSDSASQNDDSRERLSCGVHLVAAIALYEPFHLRIGILDRIHYFPA